MIKCERIGCNKEACFLVNSNDGTNMMYLSCKDHAKELSTVITYKGGDSVSDCDTCKHKSICKYYDNLSKQHFFTCTITNCVCYEPLNSNIENRSNQDVIPNVRKGLSDYESISKEITKINQENELNAKKTENNTKVCSKCGKEILDEVLLSENGKIVCEDCF